MTKSKCKHERVYVELIKNRSYFETVIDSQSFILGTQSHQEFVILPDVIISYCAHCGLKIRVVEVKN